MKKTLIVDPTYIKVNSKKYAMADFINVFVSTVVVGLSKYGRPHYTVDLKFVKGRRKLMIFKDKEQALRHADKVAAFIGCNVFNEADLMS